MSRIIRLALVATFVAAPLPAQRPPAKRAAAPATTKADTGGIAKSGPAYALDFQDQDIHVVLSALAEAGNVNMSYSNLPDRKVTLRMGQPASRAEITDMIKGIAAANDLTVTQTGSLLQITGPEQLTPSRARAQQAQQAELKLYVYRLKHANAAQLAPVLMSLFSGAPSIGGIAPVATTTTTGGNSITTGGFGASTFGRGAGGAGAGGAAPTTTGGGGGGGGAGGFGGFGGGGGRGGAFAALTQALTNGTLSNSAAQIRIVGEQSSNSLLVRATAADWSLIEQVVQSVDLRPLQVLIEVTIAEVDRTRDLEMGISGTAKQTKGNSSDSASFPSVAGAQDLILALTGGRGAVNYNVAINALEQRGDVRILSLPVIIAENNQQAVMNVGEQVPFVQVAQSVVTGTVPTTVQTIQYLSVGTVLTITPTINPDGYVNLAVDQTNNSATNQIQFNAPVISQREATTQVFLKDGQTTVIGGLAGNSLNNNTSGIPFLSRIPIIGGLFFGNTQKSASTTELFLFLTPHIISTDDDIDKLRKAMQNGTDLLKGMPIGPRIVPAGDTIQVGVPVKRPDSTGVKKPDSTGVRRPDSTASGRSDSTSKRSARGGSGGGGGAGGSSMSGGME
jgi:type II secretory pathway component GspD/PulD (secretin)